MGGSFPCNTDAIFIVFQISFSSAITLLFRHAFPSQEQPLDPRPHCLFINGFAMLQFFVDSHTILSTHRVHGTSAAWCFLGSIVQCTLDQGSLFRFRVQSNYSVVVVTWTFVVQATYTCHDIGARCCKEWDTHPVLKNICFSFFQILVS